MARGNPTTLFRLTVSFKNNIAFSLLTSVCFKIEVFIFFSFKKLSMPALEDALIEATFPLLKVLTKDYRSQLKQVLKIGNLKLI
jgi:hypothetical protein